MSSLGAETKLRQVQQALLRKIQSGEYSQGMQLPSGRQLAQQFGISYLTANNVLRGLEQEGIVRRVGGVGSFVQRTTPVLVKSPDLQVGYLVDVQKPFFGSFFSRVLELGKGMVNVPLKFLPGSVSVTAEQHSQWMQEVFQRNWDSLVVYGDRLFPFRELKKYENLCQQLNFIYHADTEVAFENANKIIVDAEQIGYLAGMHFLKKKRSRLCIISQRYVDEVYRRRIGAAINHHGNKILSGVERAYQEAGVDFYSQVSIIPNDNTFTTNAISQKIAEEYLNFFVMGDFHARIVYEAAGQLGVKVGEHIHVLGMNNIPFGSMLTPGLSTIDLNTEKIGEVLTTAIQEKWRGKTVKVAPKIVLRASSK